MYTFCMRTTLAIIMLLAAAAGVFYLGARYEEPVVEPAPEAVATTTPAAHFQERLIARGTADIGRPIEGFDPQLLMLAYPGMTPADFDGATAFEGRYVFASSTAELTFVRTTSTPMSSAERTLDEEGYVTLFTNLEERLGMRATTEPTIEALIDRVDTGERVAAGLDERVETLGVAITPLEVVEDSRCPTDTTCVQAGTVRVRALLESEFGSAEQEFELATPYTTEAEEVTLMQVMPLLEEGVEVAPEEYVFTFQVTKR